MAIILECNYNVRPSTLTKVKSLVNDIVADIKLVLLDPTKDFGAVVIKPTKQGVLVEVLDKYEFSSNTNMIMLEGDYEKAMAKVAKLLKLPLKYSIQCELEVLLKGEAGIDYDNSENKLVEFTPATLVAWLLDATHYNTYSLHRLVVNFATVPNELEIGARSNRK